jgi:hypothetical protein
MISVIVCQSLSKWKVYVEVSEDWSGVSKLAVDIVTTAEPSRMPKSIKLSQIVIRCPVDAFEDQAYKDILATLKKVNERLDNEKLHLRKYNLEKGAEESVKKIWAFKDILLQEPSSYLRREKYMTLLNPEKIVNEVDSLTRKVLMVMIMVVTNMADISHARRASLVITFFSFNNLAL